jgi:hypothetical protein
MDLWIPPTVRSKRGLRSGVPNESSFGVYHNSSGPTNLADEPDPGVEPS